MFIVVYTCEARKVYAPHCGERRLHLESDQDQQERWDPACGRWYRWHLDLLACTWLTGGDQNDLRRAREWAERNGWTAAVCPDKETDYPLRWARKQAREAFWGQAMESSTL